MTERWEADGYDALRVVGQLQAENARLQAQLDGWNYTDAKELRAENARLKAALQASAVFVAEFMANDTAEQCERSIYAIEAVLDAVVLGNQKEGNA